MQAYASKTNKSGRIDPGDRVILRDGRRDAFVVAATDRSTTVTVETSNGERRDIDLIDDVAVIMPAFVSGRYAGAFEPVTRGGPSAAAERCLEDGYVKHDGGQYRVQGLQDGETLIIDQLWKPLTTAPAHECTPVDVHGTPVEPAGGER